MRRVARYGIISTRRCTHILMCTICSLECGIEIYLRISRNNRNEEINRGTPSLSFVATLNGVDLLHASWSSLQLVPGTLSTCRYSAPGHHVDFMRFYSHNYRTALQKSVVFVVDR